MGTWRQNPLIYLSIAALMALAVMSLLGQGFGGWPHHARTADVDPSQVRNGPAADGTARNVDGEVIGVKVSGGYLWVR